MNGPFYRYHQKKYLYGGDEFWKCFIDADQKWRMKERFAGELRNPGHFFALDPVGAQAEARHYELPDGTRPLLSVQAQLKYILDLTNRDVLRHTVSQVFTSDWQKGVPALNFLPVFVDQTSAGNLLTDRMGRWAFENGYDGILFYGARAIPDKFLGTIESAQAYDPFIGGPSGLWDAFLGLEEEFFHSAQSEPRNLNLVAFSGIDLVRRISSYQVDTSGWVANPLFGKAVSEIDRLYRTANCEYDSRYQELMFIVTASRPDPRGIRTEEEIRPVTIRGAKATRDDHLEPRHRFHNPDHPAGRITVRQCKRRSNNRPRSAA